MINIIAILSVGFGIAGCIFAVFKIFGRKAPRYLVPLAAGVSMICYSVYDEYAWYERTVDTFPPDIVVVKEFPDSSLLRPWSLLIPSVEKFVVMDTLKVQRHKEHADFVMVETAIISRYANNQAGLHMFNCNLGTRADVGPKTTFDDNGMPVEVAWVKADPLGLMYQRACSVN